MIRLGLERITRLLAGVHLPWRAIHVAGTNGKGSICSSLAYALHAANIGKIGRFTSPHLIDRWDCITISGKPVSSTVFMKAEAAVKARNDTQSIGASEFELLTATAFEIFTHEDVKLAVIECGMGGLRDATNVLAPTQLMATVISHISLDHQAFLGNTVEAIAEQKAGIMKAGTDQAPCIVDGSNERSVLQVIDRIAAEKGVSVLKASPEVEPENIDFSADLEVAQQRNFACALTTMTALLPKLKPAAEFTEPRHFHQCLLTGLTQLPGRYQTMSIEALIPGREKPILLDGAHNTSAWQSLARYVAVQLRPTSQSIVWVFALSDGRPLAPMLETLVQKGDCIIFTKFGPADGMPWVTPTPVEKLQQSVIPLGLANHVQSAANITDALKLACNDAKEETRERAIVVAGSLYLVSDVLRAVRDANTSASGV